MGMRSGKALKVKRTAAKTVARKKAAPKKAVAKRAPAKTAKPKVVTRTVTVDRNAELRALAQRIVDVTVANDDEGMFALYAPDVESREASNPPTKGIGAIREKFAAWRAMASDAVFQPRAVVADGRTIVIEWSGRVTLAATGRVAELNEVAVHEIEHGKIARERFYYDPALLQP
jgi:ketosteroid isomerase-like protein